MTKTLGIDDVLGPNTALVEFGVALHWLAPRRKNPMADDWSVLDRADMDHLKATYVQGANIGWRLGEVSNTPLGYLMLIDLDVRKPEKVGEAHAALDRILPDWRNLPSIISGSGGQSRHFVFFSDKPFRSKKLISSPNHEEVWDARLQRNVKKKDWEIDFFGSGKQAVLPPSIHPDAPPPRANAGDTGNRGWAGPIASASTCAAPCLCDASSAGRG